MCFTLALAYALALASVINYDRAPNCGITYDRHYDDRNSFIIQATVMVKFQVQQILYFQSL